jgi:putative hydrolase of the HAD superfamily
MAEVTTLFWDIGGVLLTNGWDETARRRAVEHFGLDWRDFEIRHERLVAAFETRQLTLHEYLEQSVFHAPRPFTVPDFVAFMLAQSQPCLRALRVVEEVARTNRYLMAAINNESLELNLYRIRKFNLRNYFSAFFSSCFLGLRKPASGLFQLALEITQRSAEECVFIDDRAENTAGARALGMRTIEYRSVPHLRSELRNHGVEVSLA